MKMNNDQIQKEDYNDIDISHRTYPILDLLKEGLLFSLSKET